MSQSPLLKKRFLCLIKCFLKFVIYLECKKKHIVFVDFHLVLLLMPWNSQKFKFRIWSVHPFFFYPQTQFENCRKILYLWFFFARFVAQNGFSVILHTRKCIVVALWSSVFWRLNIYQQYVPAKANIFVLWSYCDRHMHR